MTCHELPDLVADDTENKRSESVTVLDTVLIVARTISPVALSCGLFIWLYFFVPRHKMLLADFGMELSSLSRAVIVLSDLVVQFWFLVFGVLLILPAISLGCEMYSRKSKDAQFAWIWFVAVTVPLLLLGLLAEESYRRDIVRLLVELS